MDMQGDMPITLVIKAPNQRTEDQTVDCMLGWTIRKLKNHLESVYPSKPKLHEQRLIYSGKLLQDHLTLKEILKQYDSENGSNTHTVHLVCSSNASQSSKTATSVSGSSTSKNAPEQSSRPPSVNIPTPSTHSQPVNEPPPQHSATVSSDGLRHRGFPTHPQQSPTTQSFHQWPGYHPFYHQAQHPGSVNTHLMSQPGMASYTPEQYAAYVMMQQQYMMQYMQYYQQSLYHGMPMQTPPPSPSSPLLAQTQDHLHQQPQQPQQQQQPPQQPAPAVDGNNGGSSEGTTTCG